MINILKYSYIIKIFYLIITISIFKLNSFCEGNIYFYILFSTSISLLFLTSFNKKEFKFFNFLKYIFMVWLLFQIICLLSGYRKFSRRCRNFDFLSSSYNEVLIVSSLAFLGLLALAFLLKKKFMKLTLDILKKHIISLINKFYIL